MQETPAPPTNLPSTAAKEQHTWGMLCHAASFAGFVIPFGNVLGPLLVWLLKREGMPFVEDQGKEAVNFQITMTIVYIIGIILVIILVGLLVLIAAAAVSIILTIIAMINASSGTAYRYPFAIRFIK